jgi:hypothetical protein
MREPLTPDQYDEAKIAFGFKSSDTISHAWFYFRDYGFTLMTPTKCGSATMRQFIWMNELEDRIDVLKQHQVDSTKCGRAYVVVRHPIERFKSLWRSKCVRRDNLKDKRVYGFTPEELMSHIEDGAKDVHWTKQVDTIGKLDVTLIPLAMLGFWWKQSGLGQLQRFNTTEGEVEIDQSLKKRILTWYAEDVILHNKAECDFCWDTLNPQLKQ